MPFRLVVHARCRRPRGMLISHMHCRSVGASTSTLRAVAASRRPKQPESVHLQRHIRLLDPPGEIMWIKKGCRGRFLCTGRTETKRWRHIGWVFKGQNCSCTCESVRSVWVGGDGRCRGWRGAKRPRPRVRTPKQAHFGCIPNMTVGILALVW